MSQFCNYELIGALGQGGMGTVYRARGADGRVVALKVMRPELRGNVSAEARFRRAPKLYPRHPNIVEIYDSGECNGTLYFAMQLVEGESLAAIVRRARTFAPEQFTPVLLDVAAALDAAHARGVIHRDIKPSNILMRASDGHAILTDFDIAKDLASTQFTTVGSAGQMIGTAHYMSPEQAAGKSITPASDVYALGAMSYEVLAGRPPFVADNEFAVARMHLQDAPVDLHKLKPQVPPNVSAVVMRALRKDPLQRYPSAGSFAQAFARAATARKALVTPRALAVVAGLLALIVVSALAVALVSGGQAGGAGAGGTNTPLRTNPTVTSINAQGAAATITAAPLSVTDTPDSTTPSATTALAAGEPTSTLASGPTGTPLPSSTPVPSQTPTPPPATKTPKPTRTPTPTPTPTQTPTPTATDTPMPTPTHHIIIVTLRPPILLTLHPVLILLPTPTP